MKNGENEKSGACLHAHDCAIYYYYTQAELRMIACASILDGVAKGTRCCFHHFSHCASLYISFRSVEQFLHMPAGILVCNTQTVAYY